MEGASGVKSTEMESKSLYAEDWVHVYTKDKTNVVLGGGGVGGRRLRLACLMLRGWSMCMRLWGRMRGVIMSSRL
jgi:hypothetical protein